MSKKLQTYRMDAGNETVGEHKATTPSKALREFFGADLVEQDGRYGKLADGRSCIALLLHGGRRYFGRGDERRSDEHVTRLSRRGGGWGFRCSCGESPNRSHKHRRVVEGWAARHEAEATA